MNTLQRFAMVGVASVMIAGSSMMADIAQGTSQPRDCELNSVMYCGAYTKAEFQTKINNGDTKHNAVSLQKVYFAEGRGIALSDFLSAGAVDGEVTKDGKVIVNGRVVATNAKSTGRDYMPGSVKSGSLWLRPTSVSFDADRIQAWVFVKNGEFKWAILKSCGNTVEAVATFKPTPTPTPTPIHTPTPTPKVTPTPTPKTTPPVLGTTAPTPTPQTLPETGSVGALAGMMGMGSIGAAAVAYRRSRRSLMDTLKRK